MGVFICVWGRVDDTGLVPCWISELDVSFPASVEAILNLQLLKKGGMSISEPDGGDVGLVDIITRRTR
jgi:hypothetical protein